MKGQKKFEELIDKYLSGTATAEEEATLHALYAEREKSAGSWDTMNLGAQAEVEKRLYARIRNEIADKTPVVPISKSSGIVKWAIAAGFSMALLSVTAYYYLRNPAVTKAPIANSKLLQNDVSPGGNKAILTIADGSKIVLDDAKDGMISAQGNIAISKNKDGQLIYKVGNDGGSSETGMIFNTISTPAGGQYQIVLSDGSKIWLNSKSQLKFPVAFRDNKRTVEITGEAYLEIARDARRPFKVISGQQVIEVLGTHFNIDAYPDEAHNSTTLLEGSVRITHGDISTTIKPGEQAYLSKTQSGIHVKQVDTEDAIAWKNGYFIFDDEGIQSIMRKIARWYDVDIVFQDAQIDENYSGRVSRFENVSQVLRVLEITGTVHFKIEGRRILVMR